MKNRNTEFEKIIEVVKTFSYDEQDIFIYDVIFNYGIKKIASLTLINDMDVYRTLMKIHEKLLENNCTNKKNWETAMYNYMCHRIKISAPPMELFEQSCKYDFNYPDITESLLFTSQLPEPKKTQIIFTKLRRYIPVAVFTLFFLVVSAGTGYAMARLGLIQTQHEKNSDVYLSMTDETEIKFIEHLYIPMYLPNGYKFSERIGICKKDSFIQTTYLKDNYELIFEQNVENISIDLDNENGTSKEIIINGQNGLLRKMKELTIIIWSENNYFYSLHSFNPNIQEKELIKIAESLEELEEKKTNETN